MKKFEESYVKSSRSKPGKHQRDRTDESRNGKDRNYDKTRFKKYLEDIRINELEDELDDIDLGDDE